MDDEVIEVLAKYPVRIVVSHHGRMDGSIIFPIDIESVKIVGKKSFFSFIINPSEFVLLARNDDEFFKGTYSVLSPGHDLPLFEVLLRICTYEGIQIVANNNYALRKLRTGINSSSSSSSSSASIGNSRYESEMSLSAAPLELREVALFSMVVINTNIVTLTILIDTPNSETPYRNEIEIPRSSKFIEIAQKTDLPRDIAKNEYLSYKTFKVAGYNYTTESYGGISHEITQSDSFTFFDMYYLFRNLLRSKIKIHSENVSGKNANLYDLQVELRIRMYPIIGFSSERSVSSTPPREKMSIEEALKLITGKDEKSAKKSASSKKAKKKKKKPSQVSQSLPSLSTVLPPEQDEADEDQQVEPAIQRVAEQEQVADEQQREVSESKDIDKVVAENNPPKLNNKQRRALLRRQKLLAQQQQEQQFPQQPSSSLPSLSAVIDDTKDSENDFDSDDEDFKPFLLTNKAKLERYIEITVHYVDKKFNETGEKATIEFENNPEFMQDKFINYYNIPDGFIILHKPISGGRIGSKFSINCTVFLTVGEVILKFAQLVETREAKYNSQQLINALDLYLIFVPLTEVSITFDICNDYSNKFKRYSINEKHTHMNLKELKSFQFTKYVDREILSQRQELYGYSIYLKNYWDGYVQGWSDQKKHENDRYLILPLPFQNRDLFLVKVMQNVSLYDIIMHFIQDSNFIIYESEKSHFKVTLAIGFKCSRTTFPRSVAFVYPESYETQINIAATFEFFTSSEAVGTNEIKFTLNENDSQKNFLQLLKTRFYDDRNLDISFAIYGYQVVFYMTPFKRSDPIDLRGNEERSFHQLVEDNVFNLNFAYEQHVEELDLSTRSKVHDLSNQTDVVRKRKVYTFYIALVPLSRYG